MHETLKEVWIARFIIGLAVIVDYIVLLKNVVEKGVSEGWIRRFDTLGSCKRGTHIARVPEAAGPPRTIVQRVEGNIYMYQQ